MRTVSIPLSGTATVHPHATGAQRSRGVPSFVPTEAPRWHVAARSEEDIVRAVIRARQTGSRVRAVGSGGSKNGNHRTRGGTLDLSGYDGLIHVDGNLVTVQAGMTVAKLQDILERHGLALPTAGEWSGATIAGAASTGTHGGSARHGNMATSLAALRLVTGSGSVRTLRRGDAGFGHAGVSLGMLGVLSEVTLECSERFDVTLERRLVPFERFLADHDDRTRSHEFVSAVWFPGARHAVTFTGDRGRSSRKRRRPKRYSIGSTLLFGLPFWRNCGARLLRKALHRVASGSSADMLSPIRTSARGVRWQRRLTPELEEVEFAVPLERGTEALDALRNLLHDWPRSLKLPVGVRPTAGDAFSLSPCFGRDVLWISTFYRRCRAFAEALADLFERFDARCHWGKNLPAGPADFHDRYPRLDAFRVARTQFDPAGVFLNPFTEELVR